MDKFLAKIKNKILGSDENMQVLEDEMAEAIAAMDSLLESPEQYSADYVRMTEGYKNLAEANKTLKEARHKGFHVSGDTILMCVVSLLQVLLILGAEASGITPFTKAMQFMLKLK